MATWREMGREWERGGARGQEARERSRSKREEGASSPFYSGPGLPGCCQVTVGQSLEGILTFLRFDLIFYKGKTRKR